MNKFLFLTIFLSSILWSSAAAGADCTGALAFAKRRHELVLRHSGDPARLVDVLDGTIDYEELTAAAMAPDWSSLAAKKRGEFISVLRELLRNSYVRLAKKVEGYDVGWRCSSTENDFSVGGVAVPSGVRGESVDVEYKIVGDDGDFKVVDVSVEGASLVSSYRAQFSKVARKEGLDELLRRLREKVRGRK